MIRSFFVVLSYCYVAISLADNCEEGFQTKNGDFWFVCTRNQLKPIACVNSDGDRIDEGSSYQSSKFVFSCSKNPSDAAKLKLIAVACVSKGMPVNIEATFTEDQTQLMKCVKSGDELKIVSVGCIGDDGKLLAEGGLVVRGSTVYTCTTSDRQKGAQLVPKFCVFENARYKPDDIVESSGVWYKCEKSVRDGLALKMKGCVDNGTRYDVGQKFRDFYFLYECQNQGGTFTRVGVGCVERYPNGTVTDYKPGDKWFVGVADNRYQITCVRESLTIRRRGIACYYKTKDGEGLIVGGCMRKVGFQILQCMPSTPQTPNVRIRVTENPTEADWARLRGLGLKEC